MRRTHFIMAHLGMAATGMLLLSSGCSVISNVAPDCQDGGLCASFRPSNGQKPSTCKGTPTEIDPATQKPKFLNAGCAVFAWAGAPSPKGTGTMEDPFRSLNEAEAAAAAADTSKWIIACNKDPFTENVTASDSLYGGFDCTDLKKWSKNNGSKTKLMGATAGKPTLALKDGGRDFTVVVEDFDITALSIDISTGMPPSLRSASSIGVIIDDMDARLSHCMVTAGNAADGAGGETPQEMPTIGVMAPATGVMACIGLTPGGPSGQVTCMDGISAGGKGGDGGEANVNGGQGKSGDNGDLVNAMYGGGGAGGVPPTTDCQRGNDGKSGGQGSQGEGGKGLGTLTGEGISGGDGGSGGVGERGHGGGGGGGARADKKCAAGMTPFVGRGASGGGGGSGGCGGNGGLGGHAGGSSIAVISLGANLKVDGAVLVSGRAGNGGEGGSGQPGSSGGSGAQGGTGFESNACRGGDGGKGGIGGDGGGGRGGYSLGIAWKVTPAVVPSFDSMSQHGEAGKGGDPPSGMSMTGSGKPGDAALCWDFSANKSCAP